MNDDHDKRHVEAHELRYVRNLVLALSERVSGMDRELRELRELVTPLDRGSLPATPNGSQE